MQTGAAEEVGKAHPTELHAAHTAWHVEFARRVPSEPEAAGVTPVSNQPDDYLAPIVHEMLALPRAQPPAMP